MYCEDAEIEVQRPCLSELDSALNELGMLANSVKSREEYLSEIQNKKCPNMLTINTRFVSRVSVGYRKRLCASHVRYKPYDSPKERHRTKSENNDKETAEIVKNAIDDCIDSSLDEIRYLKKAKSLESIIAETAQVADCETAKPSEVEVVSKSIQNLRVKE
ncbi:hypothetical protein NQ315_001780 [Exocentrus adspersus]|uniref:Uncharacterized protein n=1 Tax=Exocentrus adspersus TaxID=1586481 RepID=A0AAV8WAY1_9CUCU|nr:hypothetical protein NQ315_001780 [Exocentrus adspersus]